MRKRAIKIIRDLCASNPSTDTTHAFVEIISRVNDEESSVQVSCYKQPLTDTHALDY